MQIELSNSTVADREIIKNLFVFYRYDLMPFIESGPGSATNRIGIIGDDDINSHDAGVADLDIWWNKPAILLPMLIRVDAMPAGFAMVARPPHAHASVDYRMEDFFVLNRWRGAGVGRSAAKDVFARYPGAWEIGWLAKNKTAAGFWRSVVSGLGFSAQDWAVEQEPGMAGIPGLRVVVPANRG